MKVTKTETYTVEFNTTERGEIMDALYEVLETARRTDMNWNSDPYYLRALEQALRSA